MHLIVREADLARDMSRYLIDRIERSPDVEVHLHTEVRELVGEHGTSRGSSSRTTRPASATTLDARMLFVFIGAAPHTQWLGDAGRARRAAASSSPGPGRGCNGDLGRRARQPLLLETSRPGVFAVGDVRSGSIKRVASAVGEGSMAVRLVHEHLQDARHLEQASRRTTRRTGSS